MKQPNPPHGSAIFTMNRLFYKIPSRIVLPLLLLPLSAAWSGEIPFQRTARGIEVKVGAAEVELAAATPTAFRLSVSYDGKPAPIATTFLDPSANSSLPTWKVVNVGDSVGIKTDAGQLLINPGNGRWTLLDAKGDALISPSAIGKLTAISPAPPIVNVAALDPKPEPHWTELHVPDLSVPPDTSCIDIPINLRTNSSLKVYGCGNGAGSLQQTKGESRTSNGVAVIPYYWSNSGYCAFAVSANDEKPATWKPSPDGSSFIWRFLGKKADLYLMPATALRDAAHAYGQLSGMPLVPPKWTFGYLQGKWGWKDRAFIEDALQNFLQRHLPVDAFFYDFEWYTPENDYALIQGTPDFPDFGWNPGTFPEPSKQIDSYLAKGVHFVGMRKPRMGNSHTLQLMREKGWLLHPNLKVDLPTPLSHVGNFANPDFRAWYVEQSKPLLQKDIYGWWNDEADGCWGSYNSYYNWNLAEFDAFAQAKPGRRLWTLNRSFSPGLQRMGAAAWTGDIQARWDVLASTPVNLLNWSLAGMGYGTCDIGGYSPETKPELLTRWMEAGVFFPIFHAHSEIGRTPHFPWLFGPEAENAMREAMNLRYRLIPYYYSLAHEAHETGVPLMRPLVMEFPDDPKVADLTSQWLMGRGLMAAPIMQADGQRTVYLPNDGWFRFGTTTKLEGGRTLEVTAKLNEIPVYVRAGTILPLGPVVQNTNELPGGPLEIQIYPGRDASFTLVEDDGETTAYLNGAVRRTTFKWDDNARRLSWKSKGPYKGPHLFHDLKIVTFDPDAKTAPVPLAASLNAGGSAVVPLLRP